MTQVSNSGSLQTNLQSQSSIRPQSTVYTNWTKTQATIRCTVIRITVHGNDLSGG